jgi:hypothetical protein
MFLVFCVWHSNRAVESESVKMHRLRPQSKTLPRYPNPRALIANKSLDLYLNVGYKSKR